MRISKLDNLKFLLILSVVIGHISEMYMSDSHALYTIRYYIYLFHMPAFLFISGLLSKKSIKRNDWLKVSTYIILYMIIKSLLFITKYLCGSEVTFQIFHESGLPWYMLALAIMFAITFYMQHLPVPFVVCFSIILSFCAGYTTENTTFLSWLRVVNYYIFFYAGYICNIDKLLYITRKSVVRISSFLFLVVTLLFCWCNTERLAVFVPLLSGKNTYSALGDYAAVGGFLRVLLCMISMIFIISLISITPDFKSIFSLFGQRSLCIYATHYCFLYLFDNFDLKQKIENISPSFWPIILLLVGVVITFVSGNKYFNSFFNYLLKITSTPQASNTD